ncbi:MAG: V-type ATP synthase subunit I [Promethearchaeota archaeon]
MVRPVKMSLLTLYIKKELLPNLLSDIIQIKYFHVKDLEESTIQTGTSENPNKPLTVLSEEDYKKRIEKITLIQTYLDDIIIQIEQNISNIRPPKKENRIDFDYASLDDILSDLQSRVDFNYRRLENMAKELETIDESLEHLAEVASLLNILSKFGGESFSNKDFKRLRFEVYTASSNQYKELSGSINQLNSPIVIYGEPISDQLVGFFVFYESEHYKLFHDLFLSYNCHRVKVDKKYIDEEGIHMDILQEDHDNEMIKRTHFYSLYQEVLADLPQTIMAYYETLDNIQQLLEIEKHIQQTPSHNTLKIEGFLPTSIEKRVVTALTEQFGNNIKIESRVIQRSDPYMEHYGEEEETEHEHVVPPSLLNMSPLLRPYQNLIELYGITNYSEVNPSFILFLMFPIIFGLMFGDIGHGICLILGSLLAVIKFRKNEGTRSFAWLLFYCGFGAIFGGFMYGEAFGHDKIFGYVLEPWLVNPMDNVITIVKMSIIVGVVVLSTGFLMKGLNYAINKKKYLAFSESIFKVLVLVGGAYTILKYGFTIADWFKGSFPPVLLVIIPASLILLLQILGKAFRLTSYLKKESWGYLIGHGTLDLAETFLAIISNIASFIRILALEMAHIGLMLVFSEIAKIFGNATIFRMILSFIIVIVGNVFVIILETVFVMVHSLRLHFYEFFSKFYTADGYAFKTIKIEDKFSNIQFATTSDLQTPFLYRRKNR